ncbi:hypothetical protein Xcel_1987 [Xylanimonas cellulosilytica DSM 15894]|uniref:Transcobalamin-like C-terminal domain-containing protein n=1 Tax=Xylanimonas cellulosilytica (strain DSM 15894 / JCM 12276 / CECT 5975 / KCTC 9989 / LMG 20990 / NBRC 107835 / XIL07) TaxID=446471 RepID=D1BTM7_XYLCX|nr:DUF4430 domain-containing protein [Xylanimonas cellulosilytica]ACZ31006.1 hypothetical protein Xcel_1987 [Xylanimonas cellulosilytica DSM 15894]
MTFRSRLTRALALPATAVLAVGLFAGCSGDDGAPDQAATRSTEAASSGLTVNADGTEVSYEGVAGKTALELLQQLDPQAFASGEGANAFVTAIGGREADSSKNEFWAFYVNGEQAQVGAGSYEMQDGDTITWKLETF